MSYTITAKVIGDKELKEVFAKAPHMVSKYMGEAIERTARETESRAKQLAPAQYGMLRQSIETRGPFVTADNIFATVSTDKNYARYQEEGTGVEGPRGQMIRPVRAKMLAWKSGGKWVFAKAVRGVKPKYFFKNAREQARPLLTDFMRGALNKILSFLAK